MEKFIYEIEEEVFYNADSEFRVKFKCLNSFLFWKWYAFQRYKYISISNRACDFDEAFVTNSKEEIERFLSWIKKIDKEEN